MSLTIQTQIDDNQEILAISLGDHDRFGCPYCNNKSHLGRYFISDKETQIWECCKCLRFCVVLWKLDESTIILMRGTEEVDLNRVNHPFATDEKTPAPEVKQKRNSWRFWR